MYSESELVLLKPKATTKPQVAEESDADSEPDDLLDSDSDDGGGEGGPLLRRFQYKPRFPDLFDRVICDEAHIIKRTRTKTHKSIELIKHKHIWFVTATPMINRVTDLSGYLTLLWKKEFRLQPASFEAADASPDDSVYDLELLENLGDKLYSPDFDPSEYMPHDPKVVEAIGNGMPLYVLDPDAFKLLHRKNGLTTANSPAVLHSILGLIQRRQTKASFIDLEDGSPLRRIGADIPPYRITTVEIKMTAEQRRSYAPFYNATMPKDRLDADREFHAMRVEEWDMLDEDARASRDYLRFWGREGKRAPFQEGRALDHHNLNPHLSAFVRGGSTTFVAHINKFFTKKDLGIGLLFQKTKAASWYARPEDVISMCKYLVGPSPKMQYLTKMIRDVCVAQKERMFVVVGSPTKQW
jgi:hypothetical protein